MLASLELSFQALKNFYSKEPTEGAFNGTVFLLGNLWNDNLQDVDILCVVQESTDENICVILRVNPAIHARADIPMFDRQYGEMINLYGAIQNQRADREDVAKDIDRKTRILPSRMMSMGYPRMIWVPPS